jgi:hypothetical protein
MPEQLLPGGESLQASNVTAFKILDEGLRVMYIGRDSRVLVRECDLYIQRRSSPLGVRGTKVEQGRSIVIRRGRNPNGPRTEHEVHMCHDAQGESIVQGMHVFVPDEGQPTKNLIVDQEDIRMSLAGLAVASASYSLRAPHLTTQFAQLAIELWRPDAVELNALSSGELTVY